jgi:hypothetical protein
MKRERLLRHPAGLSTLLLTSFFARSALGQAFGSVTLAPGQVRLVSIGATYRTIRVCNDLTSSGSVIATIRTGSSRTLSPGECIQDSGNMFSLQNRSASPA